MDEEKQQQQNRRSDDVNIELPFGKFRFPGKYLSSTVVVIAAVGALGYMIRDHDLRQAQQLSDAVKQRTEQLTGVVGKLEELKMQQKEMKGSVDTVAYILLLNEKQRSQYRFDMPEPMRKKLLEQERPR